MACVDWGAKTIYVSGISVSNLAWAESTGPELLGQPNYTIMDDANK